jgi:serine protease Do
MNDLAQGKEMTTQSTVPIVVILSGPNRGHSETLSQKTYRIVLAHDESVQFVEPDGELETGFHATLHRATDTYEIEVASNHNIWVNGQQVKESQLLQSGDLLEVGHKGPLFRYRIYKEGLLHKKSFNELVTDSFDCAQVDRGSRIGKTYRFFSNITRDIATQTTLWFRIWVLTILTLLVISIVFLLMQNMKLQKQVVTENVRIESIEEILQEQKSNRLTQQDLLQLQAEVESQLSGTFERLEQLETGSGRSSKIIAAATPSVVFLLGVFGYVDPDTGRLFRYIESEGGLMTRYTFEEEGKVVEVPFTGSAFVISKAGLLLTNRHVMEPWRNNSQTNITQGRKLLPKILRLYAYYPELSEPLEVTAVHASDYMDLAVLRTKEEINDITPLEFQPRVPEVGDEVLLLAYPTGIRALVARASSEFLESIEFDDATNYWSVANRLSEADYIKPLATRGIIGQITDKFIVYDAETSFGGSGGPVFDENGKVIAVNAALLPEFGGSNMGVPAQRALYFLAQPPKWKKIDHN